MSSRFTKPWLYAKAIGIPLLWHGIGRPDKEDVRDNFYNKGYRLSQNFKDYPTWDRYAEPFLVSQFTNIFTAGNSFIEGMVSDNEDQKSIQSELDKMRNDIKDELDDK